MKSFTFTIPGQPKGKMRPKVTMQGGFTHAYTPKETTSYENYVRVMYQIELIGNLTRDPELTETTSGTSVCRFSIAVNRNYYGSDGERKTDFFNCVAWRGLGETIAKYCRKGHKVGITGNIEARTYEDNKGTKHNTVDIIVQDVDFLTPKTDDDYYPDEIPDERPAHNTYDDNDDCPF